MKHLLKPTGQILTTAVMTSTAVDVFFPLVANPLPPDFPLGETEPDDPDPIIDAAAIAHQAETVAPPEREPISQVFPHQEWTVLPEYSFANTTANTTANASAPRELAEESPIPAPDQPMNQYPNPGTTNTANNTANNMANLAGDRESIFATPSTRTFRPTASPSSQVRPPEQTREAIAPITPVDLFPADAAPIPNFLEELNDPRPAQRIFNREPLSQETLNQETLNQETLDQEPLDRDVSTAEPSGMGWPTLESSGPGGSESEIPATRVPPTASESQADQDAAQVVVVETMEQTQNWLEQKLATIVAQTRDRQAFDTRQRLIDYARESIEIGDLAEARNVATHPILTPEEQEALTVAIAQAEATRTPVQGFIPLVPLNEELDLIAIQPSATSVQGSPPVGELPVLPTISLNFPDSVNRLPHVPGLDYLSRKGTPPLSQLPLIPLATSGLHQWPGGQRGPGSGMGISEDGWPAPSTLTVEDWERCWANQVEVATMSPNQVTFGDRASFSNPTPSHLRLAHYSQQSRAEAIAPMDYIGTGQQPPSVTPPPSVFPSGADFLAGVGQQPPSILAESGGAEANVWSAEPMTFKWTRDRLNQELAILMANTTPADCQVILSASAASDGGQDIGGPTLASLTGYEWLSQFTLPQQRAEPASRPVYMILPLPHAAPLTSKFGWRSHPIFGGQRFHFGLDYGAPHGTPILASIPGRVETTGSLDGYGLTVIVENEELGLRTLYAHMSGIGVDKGDVVDQGTVLGWVGSTGNSTGPHLHFEVHRYTDEGWVAIDPLQAAADLIEATKSRTAN